MSKGFLFLGFFATGVSFLYHLVTNNDRSKSLSGRKSRGLAGALAACHMLQSGGLISQGGTSVQIADRSQAFDSLDTLGSSRHPESRAWSAKVGRRELSRIVD